jgi:hypothetical protein
MESPADMRPRREGAGILAPVPDYAGRALQVGDKVLARWQGGGVRFPGVVAAEHLDGTFDIRFDDGDFEPHVPVQRKGVDGPEIRHFDVLVINAIHCLSWSRRQSRFLRRLD